MVRICHIADVHLGAPSSYLGEKADLRKKDFENTFEKVITFCCDPSNRIDALIIAGDLFDTANPPPSLVAFVQKNMARLAGSGVSCLIVPGTHDAWGYNQCVYKTFHFSGAEVLSSPTLEKVVKVFSKKKVFFYGMAYIPGLSTNPFESFFPVREEGIHIGIVHGSLEQPPHWDRGQDLLLSREDVICSNLDYLALGHCHAFQQRQFGKTLAVYPGSLEGDNFSEVGERFMVIVDFAVQPPRLEKVAVNTRTIKEIEIPLDRYSCGSHEDIITLLKPLADPQSIVRITLVGSSEVLIDTQVVEQLLSDSFFFLTVKDNTTFRDSSLIQSWKTEKTIRGMFVSKLLKKIAEAEGKEKSVLEEALKIGVTYFEEESV